MIGQYKLRFAQRVLVSHILKFNQYLLFGNNCLQNTSLQNEKSLDMISHFKLFVVEENILNTKIQKRKRQMYFERQQLLKLNSDHLYFFQSFFGKNSC